MFLNIDLDPATGAVIIDGGRLEDRALDPVFTIEQASGAMVPHLGAKQMAGVIFISQANIGVTAIMFTGSLAGNLANGVLTARNVTFSYRGQTEVLTFVMTTGAPPPAATPPPLAPTPVNLAGHALGAGEYLDTTNSGATQVTANPRRPSFFTSTPIVVTELFTYHWNGGRGEAPGTIELISLTGAQFGPYRATGSVGSDNVQNVNWTAQINQPLPPGTYSVVDSSPSTWSENAQSQGQGFAKVLGHAGTASPTPTPTRVFVGRQLPVLTPVPTAAPVIVSRSIPTPTPGPTRVLLDTSNVGGVTTVANPTKPIFMSATAIHVTEIWTYHWNNGRGETPGTISLVSIGNGTTYGPWRATGSSGSDNAPNVNWTVNIDQALPAGSYSVVDSSPSTWSENLLSHGAGFAKVWGHP